MAVWAGVIAVLFGMATSTPALAGTNECSTVNERLMAATAHVGRFGDVRRPLLDELARCRRLPGWEACEALRQQLWDATAGSSMGEPFANPSLLGERYRWCLRELDRDPTFVYAQSARQRPSPAANAGMSVAQVLALMFGGSVAVLAVLLPLAVASDRRHRASTRHSINVLETWAGARGWTVHRQPPADRWWTPPGASVADVELAAQGRADNFDVAVMCSRTDGVEGGTIDSSSCVVRLTVDRPRVTISGRRLSWTRGGRIGDTAFDRRLVLWSGQDVDWSQVVTDDLRRLLAGGSVSLNVQGRYLSVDGRRLTVGQSGWPQTPRSWAGLVSLAVAAARAIDA